jgi:hypothetical protein
MGMSYSHHVTNMTLDACSNATADCQNGTVCGPLLPFSLCSCCPAELVWAPVGKQSSNLRSRRYAAEAVSLCDVLGYAATYVGKNVIVVVRILSTKEDASLGALIAGGWGFG